MRQPAWEDAGPWPRPSSTSLPANLPALPRPRDRACMRSRRNRIIGGVAAGVAEHLGAPAWAVRLAFVVLTAAAGFGLVVYLLLWLLAPLQPADVAPGTTAAALRGAARWPPADRDAAGRRWRDRIALAAGLHVREHPVLADRAGRHRLCRHLGPQWRRAPAVGSCQPGEPAGIGPVRGEAAGAPDWGDLPDPGGDGDRAGRHHRPRRRHERDAGRDRHHRRAGPGVRPMGLEPGPGADRGADQPGAVRGARRDGGPPARLGAADAGADPACPRAARDGDAGAHPGARAARLAVRTRTERARRPAARCARRHGGQDRARPGRQGGDRRGGRRRPRRSLCAHWWRPSARRP